MKRLLMVGFAPALIVFLAISAGAQGEKTPSVKEAMAAQHKGPNSLLAKLKKGLATATPDWAALKKDSSSYATFAVALTKNDAPKGDAAAWTKAATAFCTDAAALDAAVQKEDLATTKTLVMKVSGSCMGCHKAHRP